MSILNNETATAHIKLGHASLKRWTILKEIADVWKWPILTAPYVQMLQLTTRLKIDYK